MGQLNQKLSGQQIQILYAMYNGSWQNPRKVC